MTRLADDEPLELVPSCGWCHAPWQHGGLCAKCESRLRYDTRLLEDELKKAKR